MDVVLHLGAHRTGTTAFQAFLAANAATLQQDGIAIWGPAETRAGLFTGIIREAETRGPVDILRTRAAARRIDAALAALTDRGIRRLIVSEENVIGTMDCNLRHAAFYPDALGRLARMDEAFGGRVSRLGMGMRHTPGWWASVMAFMISRDGPVADAGTVDALAGQGRGWRDLVQDALAAFPGRRLAVWRFGPFVACPQGQLSALLDQPVTGALQPPGHGRNGSPGRPRLAAMLAARGVATLPPRLAMPAQTGAQPATAPGLWMPFSPGQVGKMTADFAADRAWLRAGVPGVDYYDKALPAERAATWEEGPTDDRHDRHLGQAGRQGAA